MRKLIHIILLFFGTTALGQSVQRFSTWKVLEDWLLKNATVMQLNQEQLQMAELTERASWANTLNPRVPTTASWLNNTDLPPFFNSKKIAFSSMVAQPVGVIETQ